MEHLVALGGFAGLAALITALAGFVRIKKDTKQLQPDHGSSLADKIDHIRDDVKTINGRLIGIEKDLRAERKTRERQIYKLEEELERTVEKPF